MTRGEDRGEGDGDRGWRQGVETGGRDKGWRQGVETRGGDGE